MLVRFVGISFETKNPLDMGDLFTYLEEVQDQELKMGDLERLVIVDGDTNRDYYLGCVVTIKDQRRFCELTEEQGRFTIKVVNLEDHQSIMEFNFFVLNKTNGLCLYQHYHQSCSASQFGHLMRKRYSELTKSVLGDELALAKNKREEKAAKRRYKKGLAFQLLVRPDALEELLKELEYIKWFQFDYAHLEAREKEFRPLQNHVKKERRKLTFMQNTASSVIADEVAKIADALNIESGAVCGKDTDGVDHVLRLMDNPDNFGEYDYDDVAAKLDNLDLESISDSWVISELLAKAHGHAHIFEAEIK